MRGVVNVGIHAWNAGIGQDIEILHINFTVEHIQVGGEFLIFSVDFERVDKSLYKIAIDGVGGLGIAA